MAWSFGFILPEAIQAVFFGSVFQSMDSFHIGGVVFAITTTAALIWVWSNDREQFSVAYHNLGDLIIANITNAAAWVFYFLAVQRIEPVVAFTIFSGMIRITTTYLGRSKPLASSHLDRFGNILLVLGMVWLAAITVNGWSGFTRDGAVASLVGVVLAATSGGLFAGMLFSCSKLDRVGLSPISQIALRFPLYILVCLVAVILGLDAKQDVPTVGIIYVIAIAIPLMAFPIFSLQKAIVTASSFTIGSVSAIGPLLVFLLQGIEGRVDYAPLTLVGLLIYFSGAIIVLLKNFKQRSVRL